MKSLFASFALFTTIASAHFDQPVQQHDIPDDATFVNVVYQFKNNSDKPIKYLGLTADCDCVQVKVIPEDSAKTGFQPGEVGAVNIVMQVKRKINQASMYVRFLSGDVVDTFKITAHLNRLPQVVFTSDKLYVTADSANIIHRVKCTNGLLAKCHLSFDEKSLEARIENEFIMIRGLRKNLGKQFVEILQTENEKEQVVGILEINFDDER